MASRSRAARLGPAAARAFTSATRTGTCSNSPRRASGRRIRRGPPARSRETKPLEHVAKREAGLDQRQRDRRVQPLEGWSWTARALRPPAWARAPRRCRARRARTRPCRRAASTSRFWSATRHRRSGPARTASKLVAKADGDVHDHEVVLRARAGHHLEHLDRQAIHEFVEVLLADLPLEELLGGHQP